MLNKTIRKKDLKEGNVLPIYLFPLELKDYRGDAVLIERDIKSEPPNKIRNFIFKEIVNNNEEKVNENKCIYYCWENWIIKYINGPLKGFKTKTKIAYYKKGLYEKE